MSKELNTKPNTGHTVFRINVAECGFHAFGRHIEEVANDRIAWGARREWQLARGRSGLSSLVQEYDYSDTG